MQESFKIPSATFPTVSGAICTFNSQYAGLPLKSHTVAVTATQSGSSTPSPDNVRSINGYSALNVSATGKNLYCKTATNTANGFVDNSMLDTDGAVSANNSYCISEYIPVNGGEDITIKGLSGDKVFVCYYDANKEYIGHGRYSRYTERTYSLPNTTAYIRASVPKANIDIFQIEYGDTATTYEAFNAHYFIQIGSTVYGGEYDTRTGVLTKYAPDTLPTFNDLSWNFNSTYGRFESTSLASVIKRPATNTEVLEGLMCSCYVPSVARSADALPQSISVATNGNIYVYDSNFTDRTTWLGVVGNYEILYPLATPQTIQLPPCPIDTLEGVNNVWADTGDTTLQYPKFG